MCEIKDVENLYAFIVELNKFKDMVKCPICLDVIKSPIQLGCAHAFCNECLSTFVDEHSFKNITCPLCRQCTSRRWCVTNTKLESLSNFVLKISHKIKTKFGCHFTELNTVEKINLLLQKKFETNTQSSNSTSINPATQTILDPNDAFDILKQSGVRNSLFNKRPIKTYQGHKTKIDIYDKVIDFKDDKNKTKILNWLNDNRNIFDRITQTQQESCNELESDISDLTSISQTDKKLTKKSNDQESIRTRRARSLDVMITTFSRQPRIKRHSISGKSADYEDINIEEIESETEKQTHGKIINLLEDEYLNNLDSEMNKITNVDVKKRKRKENDDYGVKLVSGWSRIKETNKKINKNVRKLKQLHVSCSVPSTSKIKNNEFVSKKPVKVTESLNDEIKLNEDLREDNTRKIYSLDDFEMYTKTIALNSANDTEFVSKKPVDVTESLNDEIKLNENLRENMIPKTCSLDDFEIYTKTIALNCANDTEESVYLTPNKMDDVEIEDCDVINKISDNDNDKLVDKIINQDFVCCSNQKNEKLVSGSLFSNDPAVELNEKIFTTLTQKMDVEDNVIDASTPTDSIENKLAAMFSSPKKCSPEDEITNVVGSVINKGENFQVKSLKNQIDLGYDLLNNFDELLVNCLQEISHENSSVKTTKSPVNVTKIKILTLAQHFNKLQIYVSTLKDIFRAIDQQCLKSTEHINVSKDTQTDLFEQCHNTSTQTLNFDLKSIGIQTIKSPGFRISSNEAFKTQTKREIEVQTEPLKCICELNKSNVTDNSQTSGTKTPSDIIVDHEHLINKLAEKYQFTHTLDNVNFDTQEAVKISKEIPLVIGYVDITQDDPVTKVSDVNVKVNEGKKKCVQDCCENKETARLFNDEHFIREIFQDDVRHVNRKLFFPDGGKKYKRIRPMNSDSDSDTERPKKVKKLENKFVRDDLSIRFQSGKVSSEPVKEDDILILSDGSDNINYDEYLEKIMKKYDNDVPCQVQEVPKVCNPTRQSESQKIIEKCEALIKNAEVKTAEVNTNLPENKPLSNTLLQVNLSDFNSPFEEVMSGKPVDILKPNNLSESMFGNTENITIVQNKDNSLTTDLNKKSNVIDEFKNHLDDSFDNDLQHVDLQQLDKETKKCEGKVNILQNIIIRNKNISNVTSELQYNLEEELAKMEQIDVKSVRSEDIFTSESEDVDIVETTPEKNDTRKFKSQSCMQLCENIPLCSSPFILPPLEFQDSFEINIENNQNNLNVVDLDATLVPNKEDINLIEIESSQISLFNKDIVTSTQNFIETDLRKSLNISPIYSEKRVSNPLDIVHNSKFSPLNVIKSQSQTITVSTSTPNQKSILNYVRNSASCRKNDAGSKTNLLEKFPLETETLKKPCIACSRLSKEQIIAISSLTNKKLATYSNSFTSNVTHMIVSVNDKNCLKDHTIKFVSAVAAGIWILNFSWIQECLAQSRIVPEEPYEVLDVSGFPGPKLSRLTRLEKPLLKGYKIYAAPPFQSTSREDIEAVIMLLGGQVVPTLDCLLKKDAICLIVTEARATQDFELCETWLESYKVVTVDIEWLSRSVGQYNLLSLRPFAMCSDDNIGHLGYPDNLLVSASFSFTQSNYSS